MTQPQGPRSLSRRTLLAAGLSAGITAVAGCTSLVGNTSDGSTFDPEEPSDPPTGTPNELHYVLEERTPQHELDVESIYESDGDLIVEYYSDADASVDENATGENASIVVREGGPLYNFTMEEAGVIAEAFNQVCIQYGSGDEYDMLVGELVNPLENQPWGWGAETAWFTEYNAGNITRTDVVQRMGQYVVYEEDVTASE
ncbi:hypothetical protein [Halovivax cerinus]|uniref:DUF8159 domain-containing protein n=1 Tax=Halovivax cerinus TaxID=1487865 RepID=A0ABD5NMS4_9EURY|nr:hypothetical protein [Halovivax cerinus]